jgi:benzoate membrane transport protein
VVGVLIAGVLISVASGKLTGHPPSLKLTSVVWTSPRFDWQSIVNISLPLVVVALTGQWVPGVAVMRNAGYTAPSAGPVIVWSSALSALLAPFGCHGLNLASITAAICTGPEAHEDPAKRYIAGISGGALYVVLGAITATVLSLFAILPPALIAALAGLALFPTIAGALAASMVDTAERDGALVTFVVSASGMSLLGLGAAFWGLLFGVAVHALLRWRRVHVSSAQDRFGDGRS